MVTIQIKPLSVNGAWIGRRVKSGQYRQYEKDLYAILPKYKVPTGKLVLLLEFGLSSSLCDIDNPVKPFVDILQSAYGFNDKMIYLLSVRKIDVKPGNEYITFEFLGL